MIFKEASLGSQFNSESLIERRFLKARKENRIALMPFVMAGDPDLKTTSEILLSLQENGADMIELGIPYSDPLADGPVIQAAASRSIQEGTTPSKVFEMLSGLKSKLSLPIILFTYSNPLINIGMEAFCLKASEVGVSGLVVPDLPLEEAEILSPLASSEGLDLVLLVAPTTPKERMQRISRSTKGFTYLVSVTGVTGERTLIKGEVGKIVKQMREFNQNPIAIGFGISTAEHIRQVGLWGADGAIVGSALVNKIANAVHGDEVNQVANFCKQLSEATIKI